MSLPRLFDSIITRLLVLTLLIITAGVVVRYYVLGDFLYQDLSQVVGKQQLALASYVARDIDQKVSQRQALLNGLARALPPTLLDDPDRLRQWLRERYDYQPFFSVGMLVLGRDGRVIADYPPRGPRLAADDRDRDYVRAGLAGQPYIGRAIIGRAAGVPVLPMGAPIRNADGRVLAVLAGLTALGAPNFLDLLQRTRIGDNHNSFLLISPRDRQFVSASNPSMILTPLPAPGVNRLHDKAMGGWRGYGTTVNAKGEEEISGVASVPSAGWFVVARLPSEDAFGTLNRLRRLALRNTVIALTIFAVFIGGGMYLVLRPLFQAASHADKMTRGERPLEPMPIPRNDEVGHLIGAFNRLLSKLDKHHLELAHQAHHDPLTGLPNRSLLTDRLQMTLAQAQRKQSSLALLFMDLDGFKLINDSHGHEMGDKVLRLVAQRLSAITRQSDTLARMGGDEFVLLLGNLEDDVEDVARTVAAKCQQAIADPFLVDRLKLRLGISIGIAIGNGDSTPDQLLQTADQAMYRVKKTGRSGQETIRL